MLKLCILVIVAVYDTHCYTLDRGKAASKHLQSGSVPTSVRTLPHSSSAFISGKEIRKLINCQAMGDLDWAVINSRLPYKRTKEQYEMRKKMWGAIDVNDNGYVSLSEVTRVG